MHKPSIDFFTGLFGRMALPYSCEVFGLVIASLRPRAAVPGSKRTPRSPRLRRCRGYLHLRSQPLLAWPFLEAVNPMHSRHLANGRYGFRSKLPMVGGPGVKLPKNSLSRTRGYHYRVEWAQLIWLIHIHSLHVRRHN